MSPVLQTKDPSSFLSACLPWQPSPHPAASLPASRVTAKEDKPQSRFRQIRLGMFGKNKLRTNETGNAGPLYIQSADLIELAFEVHLSNFIGPISAAISSYYLTSSASHLTSISELLSGVFLAVADGDCSGTLTAVK